MSWLAFAPTFLTALGILVLPGIVLGWFLGSSDIRWGSWGKAAGGEEHADSSMSVKSGLLHGSAGGRCVGRGNA